MVSVSTSVVVCVLVILSLMSCTQAGRRRDRKRDRDRPRGRETGGKFKYINGQWCAACELSHCAQIAPANCPGEVRRDVCGCCPVCVPRAPDPAPTPPPNPLQPATGNATDIPLVDMTTKENPCDKVACGKRQVCMLNIQGIPMCRCPSAFWCRSLEKNPLCGKDGVTYRSRCYLKMAECETDRNIVLSHKGRCRRRDRPTGQQEAAFFPANRASEKKEGRRRQKQIMRLKRKQHELHKVEKRAQKMRERNEELEQKLFPEDGDDVVDRVPRPRGEGRGAGAGVGGGKAAGDGVATGTHPLGKERRRDSRLKGKLAKLERKKDKKGKKLRRRKRRQGLGRRFNKLWS